MKRAIPVIILICMMVVFIPAPGSDASGADDGLWVNGDKVTDSVTNEKWSYDAASNTLVLNGASFNNTHLDNCSTGIFDPNHSSPVYDGRTGSNLKIVLYGDNEILPGAGSDSNYSCGIFSINNVEISGTGSLHIHGGGYQEGIYVDQHLVIDGGTITIDEIADLGTDVEIPNRAFSSDSGFTMNKGTLNLSGNGDLTVYGKVYIKGGTINSVSDFDDAFLSLDTGYQDGIFDMTGGIVNFTNAKAGQILVNAHPFEILTKIVLDLHESPLNNVVQNDNTLRANNAGIASFGMAPKEFKITFDPNEGTCTVPSALTDVDGTLSTLPEATRDGYEFKGWFTEKESGDQIATTTVFTKDTTVYAHWSEKGSAGNNNTGLYIGIGVGAVAVIAIAGALIFFKRR